MAILQTITLPNGKTYDLGVGLPWKGTFSGTIDSTSLDEGIYELNGFSVTIGGSSKTLYGTLTQYPDTYKTQVINAGIAGESRVYTRRYLTGSSSWTAWSDYTPYGTVQTFSPTFASPAGVTINRSHFMRLGPIAFVHIHMTLASTLTSNTVIYEGMPTTDVLTDFPSSGNGLFHITQAGYLRTSGSTTAGNYALNCWYYAND